MKYCLFPFFDQYQLINNGSLINGNINYIIPLKSWYDCIKSSHERLNGVEVLPFDDNSIQFYDILIVLPSNVPHANKAILDFIILNLANKKTIYNYHEFLPDVFNNKNEASIINNITYPQKIWDLDVKNYILNPIKASIIYNTSIVGGYYHTDIDLFLSKRLKEYGANICVISACPIAELYGFVPFPIKEFKNVSLFKSVQWINKFFHELDEDLNPDVFIISMPEQLIAHDSRNPSIGLANYICTNAVLPDYTIINILMDNYPDEILDENINLWKKRVSCGIDAIVLSDIIYDLVSYSSDILPSYQFFRGNMSEQALICDRMNVSSNNHGYVYNNQKIGDYELLLQNILLKITKKRKINGYEKVL